jgi:hypothetical protein
VVRNLRPLVIPAGTGNGIGIAVGAGGSAGISHGSRCVNSPNRNPVAIARSPIAAWWVISRPANPVSRLPSGAKPRNPFRNRSVKSGARKHFRSGGDDLVGDGSAADQ